VLAIVAGIALRSSAPCGADSGRRAAGQPETPRLFAVGSADGRVGAGDLAKRQTLRSKLARRRERGRLRDTLARPSHSPVRRDCRDVRRRDRADPAGDTAWILSPDDLLTLAWTRRPGSRLDARVSVRCSRPRPQRVVAASRNDVDVDSVPASQTLIGRAGVTRPIRHEPYHASDGSWYWRA
jgi:hypothetical protein